MSNEQEVPGGFDDTDAHDHTLLAPGEGNAVQKVNSNGKQSDIKWKQASKTVDEQLMPDMSNEDLWLLIRRFNKQIHHVKAIQGPPQDELDLNRADEEHFPPEKLRATTERFYTSVVVGLVNFFRHITRLRSWREPRRTSAFCITYFVAWFLDLLIPLTTGVLVALILSPSTRSLLFPPGSTSRKGSDAGGSEQSTRNSITSAPETYKGEAAEQEASNLVNDIANVAMESARGKYGQSVIDDDAEESSEPEPVEVGAITADVQAENAPAEDKTKKPMKKKISKATNQTMRIISDITDIYEQFSNLLTPTPPFLAITPRLQLVGALISIGLMSLVTSSHFMIKSGSFIFGLAIFGDPVLQRSIAILNDKVANWKEYLDLQNTLLKGVPTNAQLTLALLRLGEINSTPLPPPPSSHNNEPLWPIRRKPFGRITSSANDEGASTSLVSQTQSPKPELSKAEARKKKWSKILRFIGRTIATAMKGHIAFDRAMRITDSVNTKTLIGLLSRRGWATASPLGPLKFEAKFERKRGTVVIDSSQEQPVLYFTTCQSAKLDDLRLENQKKSAVLFQIPITEIKELKKTEGLGWKGKLIVELTADTKHSIDGLVISRMEPHYQSYHLTGMRGRNQLFNRLIAMDAQFWESH
ncbi:hypothetical protein BDV32DRAFT_158119 [Aspergillus pseudonomiae]|uniref:Uncharacterized protein n=1 Tax=Aspergillus pseudonomiae TaxID=1506151 RepID=A0A5N6IG95_9EURO|nr:uncharacterized protein BDV37DRAFT_256072 [Aspergillus pseudonomiae]KAB8265792.1 hypothetical protein BDV32DRAFT_158119 [Aspergillus pseudonomiae]KAE8401061.1 hypothetical protein BDV37DRAFT_256072 [Aspergillus pseudonomiae]